jgi:hypothetical protein
MTERPFRDAIAPQLNARQLLEERGVRFHLFVDSAEGVRAPLDRRTASDRAERAMRRLAQSA